MVPGTIASVPMMIVDWENKFIDASVLPTGRLLLNVEFVGDLIVAKRLGVGRYLYEFMVPKGTPNGSKVHMEQEALAQSHQLRRIFFCGEVNDYSHLATIYDLAVINEGLKTVSLDAGIPHLKNLPKR
jgi:hypothetical protein